MFERGKRDGRIDDPLVAEFVEQALRDFVGSLCAACEAVNTATSVRLTWYCAT
jgi:hypothetical protein